MSEMDILERYLKENDYRYERIREPGLFPRNQIIVYDAEGNRLWDAICHRGSYGYEEDLLEIMGTICLADYAVEGWLTADEVIERINGHEQIR